MYVLHCHIFEQTIKNYSRMVLKKIALDSLSLIHQIVNKIEIPWKKKKNTLKLSFHIKLTTYKQKKPCPLRKMIWIPDQVPSSKFTVSKFIGPPWFREVSTVKDGIKIPKYSYIFPNLRKSIIIKYTKICGKENRRDWNTIQF